MDRPSFVSPLRTHRDGIATPITSGTARLRPLRRGEIDPQLAVFDAMSPDSRYSRYLTGVPALTAGMRRTLAAVDGVPAGVARYVMTAPGTAEVALEVVDALHGRGLGGVLLDTVTTVAAGFGVERLQATVLPSNHACRHLLSLVDLRLVPSGALLEADGPFRLMAHPRVDRPAVVSAAYATLGAAAGAGLAGHRIA